MAKGNESKEKFYKKMLETFEGAFLYNGNKEIRIPMIENGEEIQLKITTVCAKENVFNVDNPAAGGAVMQTSGPVENKASEANLITPEEKESVEAMLERLGL